MNNEEKILEILTQMQDRMDRMEAKQDQTNDRLTRMEADISGLKTDVSDLKTGQAKMEADISGIKVRLDVDIQKQIDQLVDGQDLLYQKLTRVEGVADKTKEKVDVIYATVTQHSKDIIELKQAK